MAFRALLFSKSPETNAAMTAACESTGIHAEACSDIFTAIEKVKSRAFSCVIPDWADQPEASFLLKRARESVSNRDTVSIAIVDNEPTSAEMRDNRLDFLIYRPISVEEADAVLAKACAQMQALSAQDAAESPAPAAATHSTASARSDGTEHNQQDHAAGFSGATAAEVKGDGEIAIDEEPRSPSHAIGMRELLAAVLVLAAVFCAWRSRAAIEYLSRTPEGTVRVLRESVAALFYMSPSGALPVGSAGSDARQDAYFSRNSANSNAQTPELGVAATASTLPDTHIPLHKASDFPLPVPVFEHPEPPPVRVVRAAIPESMRNSPPIAPPVVVTVNPAQMMPVSAPQTQPTVQQVSEPVALSEQAARALLVHTVDPVYPPEGLAQKLHGPVVLQALIARDGSVEDLKIVRGYFILGRAAIAAVKQWRFQPYTLNGHAASTQTVITINFTYPPG
ncbi:MAG: TonB family protein [Acidobacteriia bacterium]|nr:TonB family protein [Terriglobia bacterium]